MGNVECRVSVDHLFRQIICRVDSVLSVDSQPFRMLELLLLIVAVRHPLIANGGPARKHGFGKQTHR